MDELLRKAFERRDQLRNELEAVDRFIASYSTIAERRSPPETSQTSLFDELPVRRSKARQAALVRAAIDEAERMILQEGKPLTRGELVTRLQAAGHKLDGTDKNKVLGTNLWRSGRFYNLKGVGYWPKSSPLPQSYVTIPRRETMIS